VYQLGQIDALAHLGIKYGTSLHINKAPKDPLSDVQRKLTQAFKVQPPKFDVSAQLSRMLGNPFKQPQAQLAGNVHGRT
jgi:hypothetical protein